MKMMHVTIQSAKYRESIEFYREIVGLTVSRTIEGHGSEITFLTDAAGGSDVEIIDAPDTSFRGSGISIGFARDGIEAWRGELEEKGFAPTPIIPIAESVGFFFVNDPDGLQVQFLGSL